MILEVTFVLDPWANRQLPGLLRVHKAAYAGRIRNRGMPQAPSASLLGRRCWVGGTDQDVAPELARQHEAARFESDRVGSLDTSTMVVCDPYLAIPSESDKAH